jgi:lipopolysaccharide exporter
MLLTRILAPAAYGIITLLLSISFVVEMLSDLGGWVPVIRHQNGEQPRFLNTAWTLRLGRAFINGTLVLILAPWIASLYGASYLTVPLRVFSLWFYINGLESVSFPVAIRRKNSRIFMYSELLATLVSAVFAIVYCYYFRTYWGMLFGILLNRAVMVAMSYCFYPDKRPRIQYDREAARSIFEYTRFAMPSSLLTLGLSQFDKVVFLRLFSLPLLGVYGLAGNIAGAVESLISKISQMVLYPRCAHNYRTDRSTYSLKYYTENIKLFAAILLVPAAVGGAARLIIALLYDPRYAEAGSILQAFMLRAFLLALACPAEDLLIASGESHIILVGNILRTVWMFSVSLIAYHFFGFMGFVYGVSLTGLPALIYYLWKQYRKGFMIFKYELNKLAFGSGVAICAYAASGLLLSVLPPVRLRL